MPPCGSVDPAKEPSQGIVEDYRAWPSHCFSFMMQVDSLPAQDCVVYTYIDMFIYLVWSVSLYGSNSHVQSQRVKTY